MDILTESKSKTVLAGIICIFILVQISPSTAVSLDGSLLTATPASTNRPNRPSSDVAWWCAILKLSPEDFETFQNVVQEYFDNKYSYARGTNYSISYDLKRAEWLESILYESRLIQAYPMVRLLTKNITTSVYCPRHPIAPDVLL